MASCVKLFVSKGEVVPSLLLEISFDWIESSLSVVVKLLPVLNILKLLRPYPSAESMKGRSEDGRFVSSLL